jgi:hypothetical protein
VAISEAESAHKRAGRIWPALVLIIDLRCLLLRGYVAFTELILALSEVEVIGVLLGQPGPMQQPIDAGATEKISQREGIIEREAAFALALTQSVGV